MLADFCGRNTNTVIDSRHTCEVIECGAEKRYTQPANASRCRQASPHRRALHYRNPASPILGLEGGEKGR